MHSYLSLFPILYENSMNEWPSPENGGLKTRPTSAQKSGIEQNRSSKQTFPRIKLYCIL